MSGQISVTPLEQQAVLSIKVALERQQTFSPREVEFLNDFCLLRYYRAFGPDPEYVIRRINKTLKWRSEKQPWQLKCQQCLQDFRAHDFRYIGNDDGGRAWVMNSFALSTNKDPSGLLDHFIMVLEYALKQAPMQQAVWICDFEGFSMKDAMDPRFSMSFVKMVKKHYPGQLVHTLSICPPSYFNKLWSVVSGIMPPEMARNTMFPKSLDEAQREIARLNPSNSLNLNSVVMHDLILNRDERSRQQKTWNSFPPAATHSSFASGFSGAAHTTYR